jgi:hypothetical protein
MQILENDWQSMENYIQGLNQYQEQMETRF